MTFESQNRWSREPLRCAAGVGRAAGATAIPVVGTNEAMAGAKWLDPHGSADKNNGSDRGRKFQGGRWVQLTYALIDICCIVVNGVFAFYVRFSPGELYRFFVSGRFAIEPNQVPTPYGGFLFLYVALILLLCQWQDLYRTVRTRSVPEESFAVVKAVSLATLLLTAFIYLSGVKVVSRLIVTSSLILNVVPMFAGGYLKRR